MQPRLLNPISAEISQIKEDETVYDNRRREPVNRVKRYTTFRIDAQIFFMENAYVEGAVGTKPDDRNLAGNIVNAKGYILVRDKDLLELGKELKVGDKIVSYGKIGKEKPCEYFLLGSKEGAHYSDQGNTTLVKWFFEDRK